MRELLGTDGSVLYVTGEDDYVYHVVDGQGRCFSIYKKLVDGGFDQSDIEYFVKGGVSLKRVESCDTDNRIEELQDELAEAEYEVGYWRYRCFLLQCELKGVHNRTLRTLKENFSGTGSLASSINSLSISKHDYDIIYGLLRRDGHVVEYNKRQPDMSITSDKLVGRQFTDIFGKPFTVVHALRKEDGYVCCGSNNDMYQHYICSYGKYDQFVATKSKILGGGVSISKYDVIGIPIREAGFSARTCMVLRKNGCSVVGDVVDFYYSDKKDTGFMVERVMLEVGSLMEVYNLKVY